MKVRFSTFFFKICKHVFENEDMQVYIIYTLEKKTDKNSVERGLVLL